MKKIMPFLTIGVCSAVFNIVTASRLGEMPTPTFIIMLVGNIIIISCNILAAVKTFKSHEK